jgi:NAD(P)-dependent dehydrogenase (short-subunit alcohol dehydrogenase family)
VPVLVVFGARNLGRTIASVFTADGWSAAAVATSEETIAAFRSSVPGALGLVGDARREADVQNALDAARDRFGSLDLIVNAIGARPRGGSFGGGGLIDASPDAMEPYLDELVPAVFNVVRLGGRALVEAGGGTLVQVTGGSARRAIGGRGPWAAGAFATRALLQSAALELREQGVHAALLIVDATIASPKTAALLEGREDDETTTEQDVAAAVRYLAEQSPRGWTHELQITPRLDRWVA